MKKLIFLSMVALATNAKAQDDFSIPFNKINTEVQKNSKAYATLKYETEHIGHRLTGSANGAKAEQYVFNLLKSYGCDVKFQPFSVESWSRKTIALKVGSSNNLKAMKAVSLAYSPVKANVNAQIIDMGNGLESDYEANPNAVKGKIALIYLHTLPGSPSGTISLHRSEKTAIAIKNGAIGAIFINSVKNGVLLTGTASVTGKLISIPAICIGLEDGMALKEKLKTETQFASIQMSNFSGIIKARNIIATFKGTQKPQEKIVVGGHLDSWDLATGAIDNGIGSFAVIDMARTFAKLNLKNKRTVEFVLFMGEEEGLLGSKAYIENAKKTKQLNNVKFMLNYDMNNDQKGYLTTRKEMKNLFTEWGKQVNKIDTGFKNLFVVNASLHSDHQSFMVEGIPTGEGTGGQLPNNSGPYYHSDNDDFKLVDEQGLKNTVRYSAMLTYALANTPQIPAKKMTENEIKAFLESQNLKEPLRIAGEWRWKD